MDYTINRTSEPGSGYNIADGQIRDDLISITLIGKGLTNYGEIIQENILHVMENFANNISPPNPIPGQLWYDLSSDTLWIWKNAGGWRDMNQPLSGRIFNQHISPDAKIETSKLKPTLPGRILIGDVNASAIPTFVDMTGDILISPTGVTEIQANTVGTAELASYINQDMQFGETATAANRTMKLLAHDSYTASLMIHGASQGTGLLYVGESALRGGGLVYNGDNTPTLTTGIDYTAFFRRDAGVDYEVFKYSYGSNIVYFNDEIQATRFRVGGQYTYLEDGYLQLQANGTPRIELRSQDGNSPYIDFSKTLSGDYGARLQLATDDLLQVYGSDLTIGSTIDTRNTALTVYAGDSYIADIAAYGNGFGTGRLYVGGGTSFGGGIAYHADSVPTLPYNTNYVTFYRRNAGVDSVVFQYPYNSNDVTFLGNPFAPSYYINDTNTRLLEGGSNRLRIQTNNGYVDIGADTATTIGFTTDRTGGYVFDKDLTIPNVKVSSAVTTNTPGIIFTRTSPSAATANLTFESGGLFVNKTLGATGGSNSMYLAPSVTNPTFYFNKNSSIATMNYNASHISFDKPVYSTDSSWDIGFVHLNHLTTGKTPGAYTGTLLTINNTQTYIFDTPLITANASRKVYFRTRCTSSLASTSRVGIRLVLSDTGTPSANDTTESNYMSYIRSSDANTKSWSSGTGSFNCPGVVTGQGEGHAWGYFEIHPRSKISGYNNVGVSLEGKCFNQNGGSVAYTGYNPNFQEFFLMRYKGIPNDIYTLPPLIVYGIQFILLSGANLDDILITVV